MKASVHFKPAVFLDTSRTHFLVGRYVCASRHTQNGSTVGPIIIARVTHGWPHFAVCHEPKIRKRQGFPVIMETCAVSGSCT